MSQRDSGYERKERDCYETPEWVTAALMPHFKGPTTIWEPAAGSRKMAHVLACHCSRVVATDIADTEPVDFLTAALPDEVDAIVTNPPYAFAREFIERSLELMKPHGEVAMLLRTDYDHAATRQHLFAGCPAFKKKVVLTKRIIWFEGPKAAPSFNHAWYIWDWNNRSAPTLAYGP